MNFENRKINYDSLNSIESEQAILGILLLNNAFSEKILNTLEIENFYFKIHRTIYSVILNLLEKEKILNLNSIIKNINDLNYKKSLINYINFLVQKIPNFSEIEENLDIIKKMFVLRKLLDISRKILINLNDIKNINIEKVLNEIEDEFNNLNKNYIKEKQNILTILPVVEDVVERVKCKNKRTSKVLSSLFTGYTKLDSLLSGLHEGELIVIAGRPSTGKTAFAINIALNIIFNYDMPVIMFSMEMSSDQLASRIISIVSDFDQHLIKTGNLMNSEFKILKRTIKKLYFTKLFIDESVYLTSNDIYNKSKKIIKVHGNVGLIIIDYLQLMSSVNVSQNRVMEISDISRSLKCLARDLNVPVIAISQLNRGLENRSNKRPVMSDLRESGSIEQDADVILFIYRDELYRSDDNDKGLVEIIISKQRNGPTGYLNLYFSGNSLKFTNIL